LRDGIVEKYAADMTRGAWTQCTAPICRYKDGDIADGQHRLWAVIESETTQKFFFVDGLDRKDGLNIDTGAGRTIVDNARISGQANISNEMVSWARAVESGVISKSRSESNSTRLDLIEKHREALEWVISNGPRGKGLRNGYMAAAIGRAWYAETDKEKLKRYCEVFSKGFSEGPQESAAICMRNYVLSKGGLISSSSTLWRDAMLKAMNSIHAFMHGRVMNVIKSTNEELYPLPKHMQSITFAPPVKKTADRAASINRALSSVRVIRKRAENRV